MSANCVSRQTGFLSVIKPFNSKEGAYFKTRPNYFASVICTVHVYKSNKGDIENVHT